MKFSSRNEKGHARKKGTVANEDPFRAGGARKQPFRLEIIQKYKRYVFPSFLPHPDPNSSPSKTLAAILLLPSSPHLSHVGDPPESPRAATVRRSSPLLSVAATAVDFERHRRSKSPEVVKKTSRSRARFPTI